LAFSRASELHLPMISRAKVLAHDALNGTLARSRTEALRDPGADKTNTSEEFIDTPEPA
jgi:hypothetical protein